MSDKLSFVIFQFDKRNGSTRSEVVHDIIQVANIADLVSIFFIISLPLFFKKQNEMELNYISFFCSISVR